MALLIVMAFYGVVEQLAHSNISNISKYNIVDKAKNWMSFYLRVSFAKLIASWAKHVKQQSFSNKCCWSPARLWILPPQFLRKIWRLEKSALTSRQKCCWWSSWDNQKEQGAEIAKRELVHVWQNLQQNAIPSKRQEAKAGFWTCNSECEVRGYGERGRTEIAEGENIELAAAIFAHNVQRDDLNWENCWVVSRKWPISDVCFSFMLHKQHIHAAFPPRHN